MLKVGIVLIGFALGCAVFLTRENGGLFTVVFFVVTGMVLVILSPPVATAVGRHHGTAEKELHPEDNHKAEG